MNIANIPGWVHPLLTAFGLGGVTVLFIALAVWSIAWKGVALWFAARNHQKNWYIALLILNTAGILEIIYLVGFRRDKQEGVTKSLFNNPLPSEDEGEKVASKPTL
jgi:hypothetical protein